MNQKPLLEPYGTFYLWCYIEPFLFVQYFKRSKSKGSEVISITSGIIKVFQFGKILLTRQNLPQKRCTNIKLNKESDNIEKHAVNIFWLIGNAMLQGTGINSFIRCRSHSYYCTCMRYSYKHT